MVYRGIEYGQIEAVFKAATEESRARPYTTGLEDSAVGGALCTKDYNLLGARPMLVPGPSQCYQCLALSEIYQVSCSGPSELTFKG